MTLSHTLTAFQVLTLGLLGGLLFREIIAFIRRPIVRMSWLLRCMIWLAAGAAICRPNLTQRLAKVLDIGRGADLVLYLFVLAFLVTSFYFYARHAALQRQVTELVRHLAIRDAERGGQQQRG